MSTEPTLQIHSESSEQTEEVGRKIGHQLKGGEVIELISDLGGGKTTLVRGIAEGMGSKDKVSSPTFTVSKEYHAGNQRIIHYDFYRLHDPGIMSHELSEALEDPAAIIIVEWADIVANILPIDKIKIEIVSNSETNRILKVSTSPKFSYILGDM